MILLLSLHTNWNVDDLFYSLIISNFVDCILFLAKLPTESVVVNLI